MSLSRRSLLALSALTLAPSALGQAKAEERPLVIRGARLLRAGSPALDDALIEIRDGKITRVQAGGAAPAGAEVVEGAGKTLTAGFIDLLTGVGLVEIDLEASSRHAEHASPDPIRAAFRAADGYDPAASAVAVTRGGGITSLGIVPRGGLVSGQSAFVDLVEEATPTPVVVPRLALHVAIDDAWLESDHASIGSTLLALRELFDDAREFKKNPGGFDKNQMRKLVASRLDLRAVGEALAGKLPVVFHVDRAADILAVLALAKENKLRVLLASAAEGWKVADAIAKAKAPVITYPLDNLPRTFSARHVKDDNAARLHAAGASVIITSGETHNARKLRQIAGNAVRAGLSPDAALDAVTRAPARAFGLDARYGSVEPGRVANLALWSGDPFELSTKLEALIVRGQRVSLASRQTALFERYK
ncbi:MAG: amidohydrolase family protein [Myxococcales bacterium]|nr:amidohydrolase family protein [Myxococcales bacterium]